jgi:ATP-dependent RNA helicase RhlE
MYSKKPIDSDNSSRASNKSKFVKTKSSNRDSGFNKNNINNSDKRTEKTSLTYNRAPKRDKDFGGFGNRPMFNSASNGRRTDSRPISRSSYQEDNTAAHSPRYRSSSLRFGGGMGPRSTSRSSFRPTFGSRPPSRFGGGSGMRRSGGRQAERIDYSKFINKPEKGDLEIKIKKVEVKHKFADFKFDEMINKNLENRGYEIPTPIQDQTIMHALKGQDVLGLANTGSGKTAAFLLPLIQKVLIDKSQKVMIIAPTRELAMQINKEFEDFSQGLKIFSTVCVGGMPIFRQIQNLRLVNHFIIGTPGRIKDLAHRRCIDYGQFASIVLDEVDHMLDMGFVDDITEILKGINPDRQSLFFSATMPARIKTLVQKFQKDPFTIDITVPGSTKTVEQDIIKCDKREKFDVLVKLLENEKATRTLIFVETKREVEEVEQKLRAAGLSVGYLHGDKRQRERARTLDQFKTGILSVLVATDVAARGIDVKDISHVINYTVPQTHDDYVHRVGRAGRAGRTGKAFTFV